MARTNQKHVKTPKSQSSYHATPSRFVSSISRVVEGNIWSKINKAVSNPYYINMGIYAACNLMITYCGLISNTWFSGFLITKLVLSFVITGQLLMALFNEYPEIAINTGDIPLCENEKPDKRLLARQGLSTILYGTFFSWVVLGAIYNDIATTYTMIDGQIVTLNRLFSVPRWLSLTYSSAFMLTGFLCLGMQQIANPVKYLTKLLLPGIGLYPHDSPEKKSKHAGVSMYLFSLLPSRLRRLTHAFSSSTLSVYRDIVRKINHSLQIGYQYLIVKPFNRYCYLYFTNPYVMAITKIDGAFLYALGDYFQLYLGLKALAVMPFVMTSTTLLTVAIRFVASQRLYVALAHFCISFLKKITVWSENSRNMIQYHLNQDEAMLSLNGKKPFVDNAFLNWVPSSHKVINRLSLARYTTKALYSMVSVLLLSQGSILLGMYCIFGYWVSELMKVSVQLIPGRPSLRIASGQKYTRNPTDADDLKSIPSAEWEGTLAASVNTLGSMTDRLRSLFKADWGFNGSSLGQKTAYKQVKPS
ncbi:MAG: hypothetical protein VXY77_04580 [Pseudomonadota bacterium]|nr:hypothetical protein [Pseudomonadota bacterium]